MTRRQRAEFVAAVLGAAVGVLGAATTLQHLPLVMRLTAIGSAFGAGASLAAAIALRRRARRG